MPRNLFLFFYLGVCFMACRQSPLQLEQVQHLPDYPSGSAIATSSQEIFVIGDDARSLAILNDDLQMVDSFPLFPGGGGRLEKAIKPDFESMTVIDRNGRKALLLLGSGSVSPYRELCRLILPKKQMQDTSINLSHFFKRLKASGLREINVEGLTAYPQGCILANRGNRTSRRNFLVYTSRDFFARQHSAPIRIVSVGSNTDTATFQGVSGLDYSRRSDKLLLSVSTEDTYDAYSDGAIGKSFLWVINDFQSKKRMSHINPDRVIDLEKEDARFAGHKIESVCILAEKRTTMDLLLAADDDKGDTWLFRVRLRK